MIAIGDGLSDPESSNDQDAGDDEDHELSELNQLSKDDEPDWMVGTISKLEQQRMENSTEADVASGIDTPRMGGQG